jgi:uncharacterized protein YukE
MTDKVGVDPELLRDAAEKTQHVSDRISDALCTLQSSADALGCPWGNDSYGNQFANGTGNNGYLAAVATLHSLTKGLSDHASSHSGGQIDSAKFHETTDEHTADGFKSE